VVTMTASPQPPEMALACPFFMPQQRFENGPWPHPSRLPLGGGWTGYCTAPGHEGDIPELVVLQDGCNLGYATCCSRRPSERRWDAIRFQVTRSGERRLLLSYVCERNHKPSDYGTLEYDIALPGWIVSHADSRIQKMAECHIESYILRKQSTLPLQPELI
jgi:hypothetical protein